MTGFLGQAYIWFLIIHILSIITWMAGLFYLPRLFVYHAQANATGEPAETFKVMERRLLKAIMNPSMIIAWVFGIALALHIGAFAQGWFHVKLLLVIVMSALHMAMGKWRKDFEANQNKHGHKFYRVINEIPTAILVVIVILVKLKPF
ncbi:protoporphyrinogen oxidase HemJ [Rhodovibrio salinarum]|uniref:Protoporphyrinogen IX oxidase n=1 Tax=Rhodovibrio salinarum TaxID=1087 RepID=A0A934UZY3_9PROT|nr:protoporphyrinogen oxidase HemJ [Rhodovibrio salinarum]MBK1696884.1 TIGR00701 family protein [Rhodovibrio salinarum]